MSAPRFKPLIESVIEETIVIEETLILEESCTTLTEEIFEDKSPNQNSNDISKYLELLNDWKQRALDELKLVLEEYVIATKKVNQLTQKHFISKSFPSWLDIEYFIDATYDENDEFCSKFEALKNDFLKKAIELDLKATQKKLIYLSAYLQDPTLIFKKIYTDYIQAKVKSIPKNLKESWDSAMKRCEYAFSQDATQLLELKLVEIEAASKAEPMKPSNKKSTITSPKPQSISTTSSAKTSTNVTPSKISSPTVAKYSSTPSTPTTTKITSTTTTSTATPQPSPLKSPSTISSPKTTTPVKSEITTKDSSLPKASSVPVSPSDKHRPSTRGKGSGSRGGGLGRTGSHSNNDVADLLNSLSNY